MQYSPKLKKAIGEIKTILEKNDIAGVIILHTIEGAPIKSPEGNTHVAGFTEYLYHIKTKYSAASFENDRFQLLGKAIHYPSKDVRDAKVAGAVNMFDHLSKWTTEFAVQTTHIKKMIDKVVEKIGDDDEGEHTSHKQQNN